MKRSTVLSLPPQLVLPALTIVIVMCIVTEPKVRFTRTKRSSLFGDEKNVGGTRCWCYQTIFDGADEEP
jgi:hypothetical protein